MSLEPERTALERFSTPEDIARHLQITRRQVLQAARQNLLPAHPISFGGRRRIWRFKISDEDVAVAGHTAKANGVPIAASVHMGSQRVTKHGRAAVPVAGRRNPMANGWLRREQGSTLFCFYNTEGRERIRTIGAASMLDKEAWTKVGDLGLDKLVGQTAPEYITFGELAAKYLARHRFNKASTNELHEQIIKGVLLPRFANVEAINIVAKVLKSFFLGLDVSDSTRGKYRAVMSRVFSWGISEELIPEFIEAPSGGYVSSNSCRQVKGSEFSQESDEALALEVEDTFAPLENSGSRNTSWRC